MMCELCVDSGVMIEYLGDDNWAVYRGPNTSFPLVFIGPNCYDYDLYLVCDAKDYQDFLFNDNYRSVGSKYKPFANAKLANAKRMAKAEIEATEGQ